MHYDEKIYVYFLARKLFAPHFTATISVSLYEILPEHSYLRTIYPIFVGTFSIFALTEPE